MKSSALQRAEIAEIYPPAPAAATRAPRFSALQRAEIAEIYSGSTRREQRSPGDSALQRAEIAEIYGSPRIPAVLDAERQCSSTSRNC